MSKIKAIGTLSITDLNDAIVAGKAPSNPTDGTLWLDTSKSPPILKVWKNNQWSNQQIDLGNLDPDMSTVIENLSATIGNIANDNIIDFNERAVIVTNLMEIIGKIMASNATTLPTTAELDSSKKGTLWQVRKNAINAGVTSLSANYIAVATTYTSLASYLQGLTPIKPWDISDGNKSKIITVVKGTFRQKWLDYYLAVQRLSEETSQRLKDNLTDLGTGVSQNKTEITTVKNQIKLLATQESVNNALTNYPTKTELKGELSVSPNGVLSSVYKSLQDMTIGGRNLVPYSGGETLDINKWTGSGTLSLTTHSFYKNNGEKMYCLSNTNTTEVYRGSQFFKVKRNTTYTLSFIAFNNSYLTGMDVWFLSKTAASSSNWDRSKKLVDNRKLSTSACEKVKITFNTHASDDEGYIRFDNNGSTTTGTTAALYFTEVMLVEGAKSTEWKPTAEEYAMQSFVDIKFNDINLAVTNITKPNGIIDQSILKDKTIIDTRDNNQPPSWYFSNYPRRSVREFKNISKMGVTGTQLTGAGTYGDLTTEVPWDGSSGGFPKQTMRVGNGTLYREGVSLTAWSAWKKTADHTNILSQINLSSEGVKIKGDRIDITGLVTINSFASGVYDSLNNENVIVGTRNYCVGTKNAVSFTGQEITNQGHNLYSFCKTKLADLGFKTGDYVTASFDWKSTKVGGQFRLEVSATPWSYGSVQNAFGTNSKFSHIKDIVATSGRVEVTFRITSESAVSLATMSKIRFDNLPKSSVFTVSNYKLEYGTKATGWTEAPEDVSGYIQNAQSTANTAKSQSDQAKIDITKLTNNFTNLAIGSRQMVANSDFTRNTDRWSLATGVSRVTDNRYENSYSLYYNISGLTADGWRSGEPARVTAEAGQAYSASIYAKIPQASTLTGDYPDRAMFEMQFWNSSGTRIATRYQSLDHGIKGKWQLVKLENQIAPEGTASMNARVWVQRNGLLYVARLMLVKGNRVMDWAPMMEDVYLQWGYPSNTTMIDGGRIFADTVTATQIKVSNLSAISSNIGTVTAGLLKGAKGSWNLGTDVFTMDGTTDTITMTNGTFTSLRKSDSRKVSVNSGTIRFSDNGGNWLDYDPNAINFYNKTYGNRYIQTFSEGLIIKSKSTNSGVYRNSGVKIAGLESYIDFHSGTYDNYGTATSRIISDTSGAWQSTSSNQYVSKGYLALLAQRTTFGGAGYNSYIQGNRWCAGLGASNMYIQPSGGAVLMKQVANEEWSQTETGNLIVRKGNVTLSSGGVLGANNIPLTSTASAARVAMIQLAGTKKYFQFGVGTGNNGQTNYGVDTWVSDISLKKNIYDQTLSASEELSHFKIRKFEWIDSNEAVDWGVIAQEVEEINEKHITKIQQPNGQTQLQINHTSIIPLLIKGWQEHNDIIKRYETRIQQLELQLVSLESKQISTG